MIATSAQASDTVKETFGDQRGLRVSRARSGVLPADRFAQSADDPAE